MPFAFDDIKVKEKHIPETPSTRYKRMNPEVKERHINRVKEYVRNNREKNCNHIYEYERKNYKLPEENKCL